MSEYYAIIRPMDHLAHYGVRGMKWGVQKARAKGNSMALRRHYLKAQKKLQKLDRHADVKVQQDQVKKHIRRGSAALGIGLGAFGINVRNGLKATAADRKAQEEYQKALADHFNTITGGKSARQKRIVGEGKGIKKVGEGLTAQVVGTNSVNAPSQYYQHPAFSESAGKLPTYVDDNAKKVTKRSGPTSGEILAGIGAAALGTAAYQAGRAVAAKRRTTAKGHAKAVAKRDAFKREMDRAFAGTVYQQKNGGVNRKRLKKRK